MYFLYGWNNDVSDGLWPQISMFWHASNDLKKKNLIILQCSESIEPNQGQATIKGNK